MTNQKHEGISLDQIRFLVAPNRYSNHDYDRVSLVAREMTDADRVAKRPAPEYGYSKDNFEIAYWFITTDGTEFAYNLLQVG